MDDGYAIKLSFESFGVQCADGSFKIYDGDDTTGIYMILIYLKNMILWFSPDHLNVPALL